MRIEPEHKLNFRDVLIRPKKSELSSRADVLLRRNFKFCHGGSWTGFPLIAANMDTIGTIPMAKALLIEEALVSLQKFYETDSLVPFFQSEHACNTFYTLGISADDFRKLRAVQAETRLPRISIDVANGYIKNFADAVRQVRKENPSTIIMAGTVVTAEMTAELIASGADVVRVGIGSGSVCITRDVTGVGMPQLSAIVECADAAHRVGGHVCADGGCRSSGDIAKAFGAGADFVMVGGMLAGHDECEADWKCEMRDGAMRRVSMKFYGMASNTAMLKRYGEIAAHRPSEGIVVDVPYRGPVRDTMRQIKAGLSSMMTYIDAKSIEEIPEKVTFVRVATPPG